MKCNKQKRITIFILCAVLSVSMCGCAGQKTEKITYADTAMGTIVQQTLYVSNVSQKDQAAEAATSEQASKDMDVIGAEIAEGIMSLLDELEQNVLSWRLESSEIYAINHADSGKGYMLSEEMQEYLDVVLDVSEKSDGALDVTIGEVARLWDIDSWAAGGTTEDFQIPEKEKLQEALEKSGFEKIKTDEQKINLEEGSSLDLGAVGKGIACDRIAEYLGAQKAVTGAVISVGGSIMTYGTKPDGSSWTVGIVNPRKEDEFATFLSLTGEWYVSTSGDYERYVEMDGVRYHHIMDPATGYPADSGLISVTIVSDSGILSDALSTACFVLGAEEGLALAESYGAEAYLIDAQENVYMTDGMGGMRAK